MKGLCQKCYSSNVELTLLKGLPICQKCRFPPTNDNPITIDEERVVGLARRGRGT